MNELKGKNIVFTGTLCSMKREEAIKFSAELGANIQGFVNEKTDMLILGPRQLDLFGADIRSRKLIKAEELNREHGKIKIISEREFFRLLNK